MNKWRTIVAALAAGLVLPASGLAAPPSNAALAKQVRALSAQVTTLNKRIVTLQTSVTSLGGTAGALQTANAKQDTQIAYVGDRDTCSTALTWDGLGLIVTYLTGSAPSRLDDAGACARIGITRTGGSASAGARGPLDGLAWLFGLQAQAIR